MREGQPSGIGSGAASGSHLWAERYDQTVEHVFDVQDELVEQIVTALRSSLGEHDACQRFREGGRWITPSIVARRSIRADRG